MDNPTDDTYRRGDSPGLAFAGQNMPAPEGGLTGAGKHCPPQEQIKQLAELGQAVATVTHELRNPLASMRTWLHVLEQRMPQDDPELARPLERLKRGVARCDGIIDDLLDYARERDPHMEPTRIDAWLRALIDDQPRKEGVTVKFQPGLPDLRPAVDRERLRRAIVNLVDNAIQAIGDSGVVGTVTVATRSSGKCFEISIADDGPGVPADLQPMIFEPFISTKSAGVGLGLAIVARVVEQHGGSVRIESPPEGGSRFILLIPLA